VVAGGNKKSVRNSQALLHGLNLPETVVLLGTVVILKRTIHHVKLQSEGERLLITCIVIQK
jgi:hypothetical protein